MVTTARLVALAFGAFVAGAGACKTEPQTLSATGRPALVEVDTPGVDAVVNMTTSQGTAHFNAPSSRYGPEYIFLQGDEGEVSLCIESTFRVGFDFASVISVRSLDGLSEGMLAASKALSEASRLWHSELEESQLRAISLYRDAAQSLPEDLGAISLYYSALGAANLYQLKEARATIESFPAVSPSSFLAHAVPFLHGESLMLSEDSMTRTRELVTEAIDLARDRFPRDLPAMIVLKSETHIAQDELAEGEALLNEATRYATDDPRSLAQIHNNLGYVAIRRSFQETDPERRQSHLDMSADIHLTAKDYALQAADYQLAALIFNNLGWLYERMNDLVKAQFYLRKSLESVGEGTSNRSDALIYSNLGEIYMRLGDSLKAERFLSSALDASEKGESNRLSALTCDLGTVRRQQGRVAEARTLHERCLGQVVADLASGNFAQPAVRQRAVEVNIELALDALMTDEVSSALDFLKSARSHYEIGSAMNVRRPILLRMGHKLSAFTALAHARAGGSHEADKALAQLPPFETIKDRTLRVDVMGATLQTLILLDRDDEALELGMALLDEVEALFEILEAERLGPAWANRNHEYYEMVIDLVRQRYAKEPDSHAGLLFETVERSRAPSLRQRIYYGATDAGNMAAPRLRQLGELADDLASGAGSGRTALERYRTHDAYLAEELDYSSVQPLPDVISLADAQERLSPDEMVASYVVGADFAFVMTIARTSFNVISLDAQLSLIREIPGITEAISSRQASSALSGFSSLVPRSLSMARRIYFVLHRELHQLPLALLALDGELLVEKQELVSTPSVTSLMMDKRPKRVFRSDVAILADPVFGSDTAGIVSGQDSERSWSGDLARLPWTAREAEKLKSLLPDRAVLSFTGVAATRNNLFAESVRSSRVLHLASHGYFGGRDQDNVGFVLSPEPGTSTASFITMTDLMASSFDNELVVVSGCETAQGQQLHGEGVMSVARAFLNQGASHVVATLWPVSDRASATFMDLFYSALVDQANVARALATAQSKMRRMPGYRDPYFWAAYTLSSISGPELDPPI